MTLNIKTKRFKVQLNICKAAHMCLSYIDFKSENGDFKLKENLYVTRRAKTDLWTYTLSKGYTCPSICKLELY